MYNATCYDVKGNTLLRRKKLRSQRMQKNSSEKEKSTQFRLICVFPEKTPDEENVKHSTYGIAAPTTTNRLEIQS